MHKSKLAKSISLLLTSGALAAVGNSANASTTYYNTYAPINAATAPNQYTDTSSLGLDGWTRSGGLIGTVKPWLGTAGNVRPFGYTGLSAANWAVEITGVGKIHDVEISQADASSRYGKLWGPHAASLVNLDTAKGAWFNTVDGNGWAHNTDIGLFRSTVTTKVTLKVTSLFNASETDIWSNFGISIFTGMDQDSDVLTEPNYSHHSGWNESSYASNDPFGTTGLTYLTHDATVDATNGLTFEAQAGQVYSIYLGGNAGEGHFDPHAGYKLSITTVPVPGAVWLFGSALMGFTGLSRRGLKRA
jgi:hypothetical protein